MNKITRRQWIQSALGAAAALWITPSAHANVPLPTEMIRPSNPTPPTARPYDVIAPPVKADAQIVRYFFTYDCPHCRRFHRGLIHWGQSLPSALSFRSIPIMTSDQDAHILAIFGRLICQTLSPDRLAAYDNRLFMLFQDEDPKILEVDRLLGILVDLGISADDLKRFLASERAKKLERRIPAHAAVIQTYQIQSTPSVAITGRFLVTPDHTNGRIDQFVMLLNGIVSRALEGSREMT